MATRSVSLLLLLLLSAPMSISTLVAAEANDEAALLAFKATAVSGGSDDNPLASWNRTTAGGFCSWEGVTCERRHRRVVALSLSSHGLNGILSPVVGNLSFLRVLDLSFNGFIGEIPASIGRLRRLQALNLSYNALSGELPANLTSSTSLTIMALRFNQLRGLVPSKLGSKLIRLRFLDLENNNFTGVIPASLSNLSSLSTLNLSHNQLEGTIPLGLSHNQLDGILGLRVLHLGFNRLSSEPPVSLYNLSSLETLLIQYNMLHGSIPADIGSRFRSMQFLSFAGNKFTGTIPSSLSNLTTLQVLDISRNKLSGYVPGTLGRLRALQRLYLYDNLLEADDREGWEFITSLSNCSQLQRFEIGINAGFTGQLPSSIANLSTTLQDLLLSQTGITGSIPSDISNLVGLQALTFGDTSISGLIPESIGKLGNLAVLYLYNTCLSGLIPSSIGNLSNLNTLDAHNCNLEGPIPASIAKLKNLLSLDLSMNSLNGPIPKDIFKLPVLSTYLDLSHNSLSGPLPSEVGSLGNLNNLVLSGNQLSGEIPDNIGHCTVLQVLWLDNNSFEGSIPKSLNDIKGLTELKLSMNNLSGTIPDTIGSIRNLQQLYLAHNNLSGPIPVILQNLTSLSELDLSFNNLQGEVPKEGIFRNLANFSITGNNELCGGIPQLHLAPCHTNSMKNNRKGWLKSLTIALATIGALLFLAFVIVLIQLNYKKLKRRQKNPFLPPVIEEHYRRVSYHTLANGTNGFSEANLLGEGSFGAVYKCTFQDQGIIAAVKVFNLEQSGSTRSFVAECEALRRVRHRCLIKIITCCSSINYQGQEFKALVFEFMPKGTLNGWLHPQSGMPTLSNTLSLAQRLDIAVDIMDALEYLHNHCEPPIIHCDIKPSNILLAEDMSARVGDFGISRILPETASRALQNSNSTIGIRGSIGYVAPEYGEGSSVSTLGDVYSLGILLLEMFTGRSPTDDTFRGSLDLHKFSEDALPERIWEIADMTMWLHTGAFNSTTRCRIENCLVSVIALGISCSKKQPRERTLIRDAATEMHAIRDSYLNLARSLMVEHGVDTTLQ
ncbi:probable LRR receptor-like serine/threonine-protein kinase At3g47570 [Phragmites australis]|uniref:probable LRR receptor-like serine/threonine-protein kinase At3g47570 n=1 Tax=Phragmites australis TaxID=29695 RepID=UPI002D799574|nr:probable LRR receptor-like serine/threonine-protein kinase At3g47570 [Phragmites australis]